MPSTTDLIIKIAELDRFGYLLPGAASDIIQAYENKEYEVFFFHMGSVGRFPAFLIMRGELNDDQYFHCLGICLTSECYATDYPHLIRALLSERSPHAQRHLMDEKEQMHLEKLPPELIIYRGVCPNFVDGFSWTLSEEKAEFFANRHSDCGRDSGIFKGVCKKQDVIAYFSREDEIFIDPENVQNVTPVKLTSLSRKDRKIRFDQSNKPSENPRYFRYLKIREYLKSLNLLQQEKIISKSWQV